MAETMITGRMRMTPPTNAPGQHLCCLVRLALDAQAIVLKVFPVFGRFNSAYAN
jgi:hypothetical protein